MATAFKMAYAGADTAVTITLASLASSATAGRESTVVSNTSNLDLDVQLFAFFTPQAGSPANDKGVYVRGYGTAGTTVYPDNVTGSDAALTPTSESNLTLLGFVNIAVSTTRGGAFLGSVATAFGSMPEKWGVWVRNYCGFALSATGSASGVTYNRVQTQGV
ncbi:MAG TPA: hypothetical protein VFA63_15010 [Pseudonocardiaceae bacterium]|nr:hypothetical protein [Pseudonocardiaceae bacterium]